MLASLVSERKSIKSQSIVTAFGIVMCVALPQLFHLLGAASGMGGSLGAAFLPMYLPVLFVGLFSGAIAGMVCGIVSPMISYAMTAMPAAPMLPFMVIELAVFGLTAGILSERKMPCIIKVLIAQLLGRGVRLLSVLFAFYVLGQYAFTVSQTLNLLLQGLPGILLQLCLLPLLMYRLEKLND